MKLCQSRSFIRLLEIGMLAMMVAVAALLVTLPWSITWITERTREDPEGLYIKYLVVLAVSGVAAELILWQARGILHNISHGHIFTNDNVRRIRTVAFEILALGVFFGATLFWVHKFFMAFLFVVLVLACCFALVMAEVFCQANEYKAENDMTI